MERGIDSVVAAGMATIHYRKQQVGEVEVFYRESGPADAPVVLLLHGFPTASHTFRDLIRDYRTNLALYPDFHACFRAHRPPLLAAWGRHDPAFLPAGAEAYERDLPDAEVQLLDAGHFALETHAGEIAVLIRDFLGRLASMQDRAVDRLSIAEN